MQHFMAMLMILSGIVSAEIDGFFQMVGGEEGQYVTIITVPTGNQLTLLQICRDYEEFDIRVDGQIVMTGTILDKTHDFPDHSIVLTEGQELGVYFERRNALMVIGYYENYCPIADLSGDCKVNIEDLAIMASMWTGGFEGEI